MFINLIYYSITLWIIQWSARIKYLIYFLNKFINIFSCLVMLRAPSVAIPTILELLYIFHAIFHFYKCLLPLLTLIGFIKIDRFFKYFINSTIALDINIFSKLINKLLWHLYTNNNTLQITTCRNANGIFRKCASISAITRIIPRFNSKSNCRLFL